MHAPALNWLCLRAPRTYLAQLRKGLVNVGHVVRRCHVHNQIKRAGGDWVHIDVMNLHIGYCKLADATSKVADGQCKHLVCQCL